MSRLAACTAFPSVFLIVLAGCASPVEDASSSNSAETVTAVGGVEPITGTIEANSTYEFHGGARNVARYLILRGQTLASGEVTINDTATVVDNTDLWLKSDGVAVVKTGSESVGYELQNWRLASPFAGDDLTVGLQGEACHIPSLPDSNDWTMALELESTIGSGPAISHTCVRENATSDAPTCIEALVMAPKAYNKALSASMCGTDGSAIGPTECCPGSSCKSVQNGVGGSFDSYCLPD